LKLPKTKAISDISLTGYNDIFSSTVSPTTAEHTAHDPNSERVVEIPLSELHPPEFHPFNVNDDETMDRLAQNIKQYGVREPGLARPRIDGGYELLAGNRRKRACELAEIPTMPVIIREMSDDDATIAMVDSNLEQRETLLFSEKAWAYKVKMEALNHNGVKGDKHSYEIIMEQTGESKNQIFRLIRLTDLVVGLLDKVDSKQIAFNPAVELSYLSQVEQTAVISAMESHGIKPSLSQAVRLKKLRKSGELTLDMIDEILSECKTAEKSNENKEISRFSSFFPNNYTAQQMDKIITDLLKEWQKRQTDEILEQGGYHNEIA
jgi:ParB family chromosome partitioning protein